MSLNATPSGERVHIGFFGKRNAGKSSIVNAVTGQELAVVSDVKGTTTDPVTKAMELLPIGPVVIIDTPGIDDEGALGELRVKKTKQILNKTDIAVLVIDSQQGMTEVDQELVVLFQKKGLKYLIVYNKIDLLADKSALAIDEHVCLVSAVNKEGIEALKEAIGKLAATEEKNKFIVADLIQPNDFVVLVTPIDSSAPKGRLILPQQQTIRDILDAGAVSIVTKETELVHTLENIGKKPALVITDSQAFAPVAKDTPLDIPLTSFSILMARYKGQLEGAVYGAAAIEALQDGDMVLISEGCTHHRQCGDIGTVKLPKLLEKTTGKQLQYRFTSGTEFPDDLSAYKLIIHCGGCMLTETEMKHRLERAKAAGVPTLNYGMAFACFEGQLSRALQPLQKK